MSNNKTKQKKINNKFITKQLSNDKLWLLSFKFLYATAIIIANTKETNPNILKRFKEAEFVNLSHVDSLEVCSDIVVCLVEEKWRKVK